MATSTNGVLLAIVAGVPYVLTALLVPSRSPGRSCYRVDFMRVARVACVASRMGFYARCLDKIARAIGGIRGGVEGGNNSCIPLSRAPRAPWSPQAEEID